MHWIYLIHEFHNLSWITEINELFHDIIVWDHLYVCMHYKDYVLSLWILNIYHINNNNNNNLFSALFKLMKTIFDRFC